MCASQSQYFGSKCRSYKATQPLKRTEFVVDTSQGICSRRRSVESTFSFSFVGDDTVCDSTCTQTQVSGDKTQSCVHCGDSLSRCSCSKQHCAKQRLKSGKVQCTPYFQTADLSVSVVQTQDASSTQIDNTLYQTQTQSQVMLTAEGTTQLKDQEGFRYRCTPFQKPLATDLLTQTQTQAALVSGTQFNSIQQDQSQYPSDTQKDKSQGDKITAHSQCVTQGANLCNMTGVFVDSQAELADTAANTSGDIFEDSICDKDSADTSSTQNEAVITSHTQCLTERNKNTVGSGNILHSESNSDLKTSNTKVGVTIHTKPAQLLPTSAVMIRDKTIMVNQSITRLGTTTLPALETSLPTTPVAGGSLQEKIKKRLLVTLYFPM